MAAAPVCPRCGGFLAPPSVWATSWRCAAHGTVAPLQPFVQPSAGLARQLAQLSSLPFWVPWPLPHGWLVTGIGHAGDEVGGVRATVVACSGPNPLGGGADLLVVTEELGVGLGARYAGLPGPDPGEGLGLSRPDARVVVGRHPTALWHVAGRDDRAAYAGEAAGTWLWLVLFPASAGALLIEHLELSDVGELGQEVDMLPFGALSPRLSDP